MAQYSGIRFFAVAFFLVVFVHASPTLAGGWVSGGGGGLACFSSYDEAGKALDEDGRLLDLAFQKTVSVRSFDLFDKSSLGPFAQISSSSVKYLAPPLEIEWPPTPPDTHSLKFGLMNEALFAAFYETGIMQSVPWLFQTRMASFAMSDTLYNWNLGTSRLPRIDDLGSANEIPKECAYVQLARREYKKSGTQISMRVTLDFPLWMRLDPLSKVALVVHEWMYTITSLGGKASSAEARNLVATLLSRSMQELVATDAREAKKMFQNRLTEMGLREAYRLKFGEEEPKIRLRLEAFDQLRAKLETAMALSESQRVDWLLERLTDHESYVFVLAAAFREGYLPTDRIPAQIEFAALKQVASPQGLDRLVDNGDANLIIGRPELCDTLPDSRAGRDRLWEKLLAKARSFCRSTKSSSRGHR